jgi:hypothetical protein
MKAICTYCAGPKNTDGRLLPAVHRYVSSRIDQLHELARERGEGFYILSGEYGLLKPDQLIPCYDHLLLADEVEALVPEVVASLAGEGISELVYYTADANAVVAVAPYLEVIRLACFQAGIELAVEIIPGNPD